MFITKAYAAVGETANDLNINALAEAPSATEAFMWNIGLVLLLVILFYILLIMPQQRRFKEHSTMLNQLKKGDRVVTGGGLIGKIDHVVNDQEVVVDLGNGQKVTALRSTLQGKAEVFIRPAAKKEDEKKK